MAQYSKTVTSETFPQRGTIRIGTIRIGAMALTLAVIALVGAISVAGFVLSRQLDGSTPQLRPYTEAFDGWLPGAIAASRAARLDNQAFDGWSAVLVPARPETFDGWSKVLVPAQDETFDGWSKVYGGD